MILKLIASLIMFGIAALFVGVGLLKHRRSHWIYATASVVSVVLSAILGVLLANLAGGLLAGSLYEIIPVDALEELILRVPSLKEVLRALLACFIAPALFIGIFLILRAILDAIAKPVSVKLIVLFEQKQAQKAEPSEQTDTDAPADAEERTVAETAETTETAEPVCEAEPVKLSRREKKAQKKERLRIEKPSPWGMLGGAVCGLLLFVVFFSPSVGTLSLANGALSVISVGEEQSREDSLLGTVAVTVDAVADNPGTKMVNYLGGYPIFSGLTTYRVGEHRVNLNRETRFLATATSALMSMTDEEAKAEAVAAKLRKTGKEFGKTDLLPTLLPELCHAASEDWSRGKPFCGIQKPSFGATLSIFTDPLFDVLADSDYDTVKEDMATVFELMATVVEEDALQRMKENPMKLFEDQEFSASMMRSLLDNPRMSGMVGGFVKFGINKLGDAMDMVDDKQEFYDAWVLDMEQATMDALMAAETREEGMLGLPRAYQNVFDDYGLTLDASAAAVYAEAVIAEHDRAGILSMDAVDGVLSATAVQDQEGKTVYLTADTLAGETVLIFLNEMKLDGAVSDAERESRALAKVLADMAALLSGGELTVTDSLGDIGLVLDDLAATELVGAEQTGRILIGLFQTNRVRLTLGCSLVEVTDIANTIIEQAEQQSYYNMMSAIGHTVAALQAAGDSSIPMRERIEGVLETMSPATAVVLQKLSLPSVMEANGVPQEVAGDSAQFMSDLFGNFATMSDKLTPEEINSEAGAMTHVTAMAMNAGKASDSPTFGENGTLGVSAEEYVDQMLESRIVEATMMSTVYPNDAALPEEDPMNTGKSLSEAETEELLNALNARYAEEADPTDPGVQRTYVAIGAMVNAPVVITADGIAAAS